MRADIENERTMERRARRMDYVDALQPEQRAIVHEYGLTVFKALEEVGVRKAKHKRHIIDTVLRELRTGFDERPCSNQRGVAWKR